MIKRFLFDKHKVGSLYYILQTSRGICLRGVGSLFDQTIDQIEIIQRKAVRFIRGREGVTSVGKALGLLLQDRRRDARVRLFYNILSDAAHSSLTESFL